MSVSPIALGKVSIIMPTYNYGRYLRESIASVVAQEYPDWELLVVDDGSTDDTPAILATLMEELRDDRIRATRLVNGGVSRARNHALEMATGDFIAFLDADDLWLPRKLSRQVAALAEFGDADFVFTNFVRFQNDGARLADHFSFTPELRQLPATASRDRDAFLLEGDAFSSLLGVAEMPWYPTANMIRRRAIGAVRFDTARKIAEDIDFFARVWIGTKGVVIFDVLCELRRHGSNASHVLQIPHQLNMIDVLEKIPVMSEQQRLAVRERIGREWASLGYAAFNRGDARQAATAYARALLFPGSRKTAALHLAALPLAWLRGQRAR